MPPSPKKQNNGDNKDNLKWFVLLTVIVGTFLGRLDQTIVNLALPNIINDFNITVTAAGWIATAYILANAVFVPIWGKLGDTVGRKRVYLLGFTIFIAGSVLAGLSWNLGSMIVFRIIQAIASSADYPTAMAIIAVTFKTGKERAQALGVWSSSFAAASVFGPLIGGPLIDTFGWRSIFIVNLPVGIIGILMALAFVKESKSDFKSVKFDWLGAITLGISLSSLVLVLDRGSDWGWLSANSLLSYIVSIVFILIFIKIESRFEEPIVDLKFFKNSVFVNTLINNFIIFMGMMGSFFLIPVFAENFLGYNATQTGYLFMPMAAAIMIAAPLGGALIDKMEPRYVIALSTFVAGIGIYWLSFIDARSGPFDIILPLTLMAFGMGFGMSQRTNAIASTVPTEEIGIASSVLALVRNIAGAFGIAIFGTLLTSTIESNIFKVSNLSSLSVHTQSALSQFTALIIAKSEISAYSSVFVIASILIFIGAFLALFIKIPRLKKDVHIMVE